MLRPSSLPHALAVVVALVCSVGLMSGLAALGVGALGQGAFGPMYAAAAVSAPLDPQQPLVPRIRSITPDYVPDKGPIVVRGTLTNVTDKTWTAINVHGFMGDTPIVTTGELSDAVRTPLDADVGHRITEPGTFDSIHSLAPGQRARFRVRLPHSTLPVTSAGVYWFGVHVLGDDGQGGPRVAVGRDRTFLAYVPQGSVPADRHEDTALVVPVRSGVARGPNGAIVDPLAWARSLRSGALAQALSIGRAARDRPLTWLVDPAVIDAVRSLARGNPARTLTSPNQRAGPSPGPSPSDSPTGTTSASSSASSSGAGTDPTTTTGRTARTWLKDLHPLIAGSAGEVLGLPYGDLALETAARYDRPLLHAAFRRTGDTLRPWGVPLTSAVAPPDGRTTGDTISALPRDTAVLLGDDAVTGEAPTVSRVNGHRLVLTATDAAHGGPGPVDPQSSLALRQRLLAEAALRLLADQQPLVVELPTDVRHALRPSFFSGLNVPWLRLTTVSGATAVTPTPVDVTRLREPSSETPQLSSRLYLVAQQLLVNGTTLQSVLPGNKVLRRRLFTEAVGNASYAASGEPFLAMARMHMVARWVRQNLDGIQLAAPESVTLASDSGRFSAIVSNELDVPVTVKVEAFSDPKLRISGGETVQLAPHGRTTVLLDASTHQRGVHTVLLQLTDQDGRPLGAQDRFPMRAEQVSRLIWVIIGAGVALLFAAIVVRLVRRVVHARAHRRTAS